METAEKSKQDLVANAIRSMDTALAAPVPWTDREKLALLCQICADEELDSGLAGQITIRGEKPGTYYTQPFGLPMDEIHAGNILLVDSDLNVLEGKGMANAATRFHIWIYNDRPDVRCIIHTHPFHVTALSMLEVPLEVSVMDSCVLYDNCAFLKEWPGIPVGNEEGILISGALGDKRAILLAHHGMLVATTTPEEAFVLASQMERTAKLQLAAMSAGTIKPIDPALGREARDWILTPKRTQRTFQAAAQRTLRRHPECLSLP
ncbi:MAG: aldolase [Burkholderiaceae bacterium]